MRKIDLSKPLDKKTIAYLRSTRPLGYVDRMIELAGGPTEEVDTEDELDGQYDPSEDTVNEVLEYLLTASDEEAERVLAVETGGKARAGILSS